MSIKPLNPRYPQRRKVDEITSQFWFMPCTSRVGAESLDDGRAQYTQDRCVNCQVGLLFSNTHSAQPSQRPAQKTPSEPAQRNACSEQHPVPQDGS